jgi:putative peptidoglycan lipid II flippase
MGRTALLLLPLQFLFRGGEAALPLLLALWFGRNDATNAQVLLAKFFTFSGAILVACFQDSAFVPTMMRVRVETPGRTGQVAGSILSYTMVLGFGIALLMGGGAAAWAHLRYPPEITAIARGLTFFYALHMFALCVRAFLVGLLNAHHAYAAYPVASGLGMGVALATIFIAKSRLGITAVPLGLFLGEIVAAFLLFQVARRYVTLSFGFRREPELKIFVALVSAEVLGNVVTRINPLVDQMVASWSTISGGGTILNYAFDVATLPTSLVQASFLSVMLSHLSEHAAEGDQALFRHTLRRSLLWIIGLLSGASLLLFVVRRPLMRLVFAHGAMDEGGADLISEVLPFALLGTAPFGVLLVLARAHVALRNTRIMITMGILNAVLNAAFNVAFFRVWGLSGIALSTSAMNLAVAIVFYLRLRKPLETLAPAKGAG